MNESDNENGAGHTNQIRLSQRKSAYHTTIDETESLTVAIPMAVATVSGREPEDFPPLYDAIDPDQLNGTIASLRTTSLEL